MIYPHVSIARPRKRGRSEDEDDPRNHGRDLKYNKPLSTLDIFCDAVCSRVEGMRMTSMDVKDMLRTQNTLARLRLSELIKHVSQDR